MSVFFPVNRTLRIKGFFFIIITALALFTTTAEAARGGNSSTNGGGGHQSLTLNSQPSDTTLYEGNSTTFTLNAHSKKTIIYTWFKDGAVIGDNSSSLAINNATLADAGSYSCLITDGTTVLDCTPFTLTVNQIVRITQQPVSQSVDQGASVTMSVTATGTAPISYQWYFQGQAISGATSSSLTIPSAASTDAGSYYSVVTNPGSSATSSSASLSVASVVTSLNSQPSNTSLYEGGSTSFSLNVTSNVTTLTYTWFKDGAVIGGNSSTFALNNVTLADAGTYSCQVADGTNTIACTPFTLTVNQIVRITQQPVNQAVNAGTSVTMSVAATGTAPISYQWYFQGQAISGATASSLTFSSTATTDTGSYYCVVTNPGSNATSNSATLSVTALPNGSAQITWTAPTTRSDGTPLLASDIAGYELYHSADSATTLQKLTTLGPNELSIVVSDLATGTHYFALSTLDSTGQQSALTATFSITIQ